MLILLITSMTNDLFRLVIKSKKYRSSNQTKGTIKTQNLKDKAIT